MLKIKYFQDKNSNKPFPEYNIEGIREIVEDVSEIYEDKPVSNTMNIEMACIGSNGVFIFASSKVEDIKVINKNITDMFRTYSLPKNGSFVFIRTEEKDYFLMEDGSLREIEYVLDKFQALFDNTMRPMVDLVYINFANNYEMLFEPDIPDEYKDHDGNILKVEDTGELKNVVIRVSSSIIKEVVSRFERGSEETLGKNEEIIDENGNKYRKFSTKTKYLGYSYKEDWYPIANDDPTSFLILTILGGWFGLHKYKVGQVFQGILYTLTAGGFGVFYVFDIISMLLGDYSVVSTSYEETEEGKLKQVKSKIYLDKIPFTFIKKAGVFLTVLVIAFLSTKIYFKGLQRINTYTSDKILESMEEKIKEQEEMGNGSEDDFSGIKNQNMNDFLGLNF